MSFCNWVQIALVLANLFIDQSGEIGREFCLSNQLLPQL